MFNFHKKTLIVHFVLFIICLAIFFPFVSRVIDQVVTHSITRRAHEIIRKIQLAPNFESIVDSLRAEKMIVFFRISLFDHEGYSIYDTHLPESSAHVSMKPEMHHPEVLDAIKYGKGFEIRYSPMFRQSLAYAAFPFIAHGREYVLRIGLPFSEIQALSHDLEICFLTLGVVLFLLYGFVIWTFIHRLSRPIRQIVAAIQPYQEGKVEFVPRVEIENDHANNEFGRLARTLNALNERIQKQIANLIEQQERTKAILESLGEGVVAVDIDQSVTFANQAACRMLGVSCESLMGRKFSTIQALRQGLASQCEELMQMSLERMDTITRAYTVDEKQKIHFDLISVPQMKYGGILLVLQNKTADYEVIEMGKDFIANASHELRTPITIIRGFAEMLNDLPHLTQEQTKEVTEKILKTSIRLATLVKSLLALADIENVNEDQFQWTDLSSIAENCLDQLLAAHPHVKITLHGKANDVPVRADENLLSMAVMNLLENAVKYSPAPAKIELTINRTQEAALLSVKDSGIGIPDADLPRIFDRFYTVNKARSRKFGGTGLGLSIVKSIVQKHHGDVTVTSKLGVGTSFTIRFPLHKHAPKRD